MPQAWQIRESQQQSFIEELVREVRDQAEEGENYQLFMFDFGIAMLEWLRCQAGGKLEGESGRAKELFLKLLPRIEKFARLEAERDYLLLKLSEKVQIGMFSNIARIYLSATIGNPQILFHASAASVEIRD